MKSNHSDSVFAVLRTFDNAMDAHVLKIALFDRGIESFITDEYMMTAHPLLNLSLGGIKLKVRTEDFEIAKSILNELDDTPYTDDNNELLHCPKCQSTQLISGHRSTKGAASLISGLVSLFLMCFPLYVNFVYKCKDCGTEFKRKKNPIRKTDGI